MATVVQALLADFAGATVVIDPTVTGEITIRSENQLTAAEIPDFLKRTLRTIGLDLIDQGRNAYVLQPLGRTTPGAAPGPAVYQPGVQVRSGLVLMGLRYVSAAEMARLLRPFQRTGVVVQADSTREMLILSGPPADVQMLVGTAELLDVDWLKGMSFGVVPLEYADPGLMIEDLKRLFGGENGPVGTMVEFVPLAGRNAILILAKRPERLDEARNWIAQLDQPVRGLAGIQVLPLQYADARELAEMVSRLFQAGGDGPFDGGPPPANAAPGMAFEPPGASGAVVRPSAPIHSGSSASGRPVRITADLTHNALVVQADPSTFADIRSMVQALDTPVPQVVIETTIAEVSLNDDFRFGIQWSFTTSGEYAVIGALSEGATGAPIAIFPGLSVSHAGSEVRATLNTLSSKTNVEVISSPIIATLNNRTAYLEVGDEVPIITQTATSVTTSDPAIVNSIQYRNTGILLKVTPRIGAGDTVTLEVSQEASEVVANQTSGIDSPTIQQRRFSSTVSVTNGQTVALGGLIRGNRSRTKAGIPFLRDIPLLGELAGRRETTTERTQLLVFLTPRIIRTQADAAAVTDDLRSRMERLRESRFINSISAPH